MKVNKTMAIAVVLFGLLMGGLAVGVLFSQNPLDVNAAPPAQQSDDTDKAGEVEDGESEEAVSPDQAKITADQAKAAAEVAYPGTKALEVELERENGVIAYEVGLDNGLEVMVDPTTGAIVGSGGED